MALDVTTAVREELSDVPLYRTVTKPQGDLPNVEMDVIGWLMIGILAIFVLPLLPVLAVFWGLSKLTGFVARQVR